jgi:hypothetical protein
MVPSKESSQGSDVASASSVHLPDGHSALMLTAARLRYVASTKWGKRRYLSMDALLNPAKQEAAA